jgi:hypothetical protein
VRHKGQFLEGMGVGKMAQVVEKPGAQKGTDPFGAKPGIGAPFRQADKETPGQVIHPYRMGRAGMGGAGVNPISRTKLKYPEEPHKRRGSNQSRHSRGKVDMPPKNIPNRVCITFP